MTARIAGIVSLIGSPADAAAAFQLRRVLGADKASSRIVCLGSAAVATLATARTLAGAAGAEAIVQGPLLFVADARLANRKELGASLSLPAAQRDEISDAALLMQAYRRSGPNDIAQAVGAFGFAAWDESERRLVLGRDCLGERALFYHVGDGFVAFASELNALLAMPAVPREIDEDALANFLAINMNRPSQTLYRGIERVPSRSLVTIDRSGVRREHYWTPDLSAAPPYRRDEDYVLHARELLDQAVRRATQDTPRVAVLTSGGLDSSAVAATAARLGSNQTIACYCVVPPPGMALAIPQDHYLSERDKVEALACMYPELTVEFLEEGALHPFEQDPVRFFVRAVTPARNPAILSVFGPADDRVRQAGFPAMLTGTSGNLGLSWFGQYSLLTLLREGKFATLIGELAAASRQDRRGAFGTLAGDILLPAAPPWLRRTLYRIRGRRPGDVSRFSCLNPAISRELDLTHAWRQDGYDPWFRHSGWEPAELRARMLFDYNQFARDNYASISIHEVERRDPLGDRTLLEFLLRVPEPMYRRNGVPRSFARKVLADRLPPEILNETRRGYQGATWFRRMDARRQDIAEEIERLAASPLASRLLDLPRMKRILDNWPKDAQAAEARVGEIRQGLARGVHVGRFIRWVEGGNAHAA